MRPIKLMMQAFGPYASEENIDFSILGNRTMFVISGKTGSGKTTIFDGISYAIYGKASGEDRNGPELRSQFASEEMTTEVALEFTLRRKRYYIWRSPQQNRKKKSGEGYTLIGAKAELYIYDDEGNKTLLAANVRDVDERIKEIMLIDSNQFRQILMIPQGEFRKLLTSDSKDKEQILQRLFHTEIYKRVEEKLKEEATELKRTVEKQIEDRSMAIRGIQVLSNEELTSYLEAESVNDTLILPLLKNEIGTMESKLTELKHETAKRQSERDQLQQSIYEAELIVKQLKLKDELLVKKDELENQKIEFDQKETEVLRGQKAALLGKQEEICHHLKSDLDQAKKNQELLTAKAERLANFLEELAKGVEVERAREPERQKAADDVKTLQLMKDDVYSFANMESQVNILRLKLSDSKKLLTQTEEQRNDTDKSLLTLQDELKGIEQGQLLFLENKRKMELLEDELERLIKYEGFQSRYKQAKIALETRKGNYQNSNLRLLDAKSLVEELERKWLQSQATILASQLHEGEACPVCGSNHHPQLASSLAGSVPLEADIKAAKLQVKKIESVKSEAESAYYESQSTHNSLEQSLTDLKNDLMLKRPDFSNETFDFIKSTVQEERTKIRLVQNALSEKIGRMNALTTKIKNLEQMKLQLNEKFQGIQDVIQDVTIEFTEKRTTLERMVGQIPEALRTIAAYESKLKQSVEIQQTMQTHWENIQKQYQETRESYATEKARLETISHQATETSEKLAIEREAFKQRLAEQGFESYGHYERAKKSEIALKQISEAVRAFREELRSITDRHFELAEMLKDVKPPDLEKLSLAFETVNKQLSTIQDEFTDLFMKKRRNEDILAKVERINQQLKDLESRYNLIGHLYEITKGQNTYRITFERFVLAAFLDDILEQANLRLTKMTSGRYQLLRKTDRSKGAGQSGLELLVFDQYTGQERHVKTLSGGESFKAALSLALGLAEVVQQHAGGVSLETMFIDEGFGTLDPESLDQAIEALIDIQSSGRLVGIISHVPELKERIDARLEVFSTQTGSRTEFQIMN